MSEHTIKLDEENLIALLHGIGRSSCGFDSRDLPDQPLEHLHCCDYNEPIYEVLKQIDISQVEEGYQIYLQQMLKKGKEYYE